MSNAPPSGNLKKNDRKPTELTSIHAHRQNYVEHLIQQKILLLVFVLQIPNQA